MKSDSNGSLFHKGVSSAHRQNVSPYLEMRSFLKCRAFCEKSWAQGKVWFSKKDPTELRQSMPEGGTVKLSAENETIKRGDTEAIAPGSYVKISIQDEGKGMPAKIQQKIFDPFLSTKDSGNRLRLATSHSIIEKHDGFISVESTVCVGSTFAVYLPATRDAVSTSTEVNSAVPIKGEGSILIMDDEKTIRDFIVLSLSKLGYKATTARNGLETVEAYREGIDSGYPFDAVIVDMTIPGGMGGLDVMKQIQRIDPKAKVIIASGYSTAPIMTKYEDYGFKGCIIKPFTIGEMSEVLHKVLENS